MVGVEEGKDKLFGPLIGFVDLNSILYEFQRIEHIGNAVEQVSLSSLFENVSIKCFFIALGDDVPGLGGTFVAVVDGV
jgi:hypothetical protein